MYEFLIPFFVSLFVTLAITPFFIKKFRQMGIVGRDVHKKNRPEVAEMGGIAILAGFLAGFLFVMYFFLSNSIELFTILATMLLAGAVGIIDDMRGMRQKIKAIIPVFAAIPLMLIQAGHMQ